jgi:hypothetical protein
VDVPVRALPTRFAVAFSLAGEQRHLVLPVAQEVEAILGRSTVFYDAWYEHWIAGSNADLLLQKLYGERAELVVMCVSGAYGDKRGPGPNIKLCEPGSCARPPMRTASGSFRSSSATATSRAFCSTTSCRTCGGRPRKRLLS